MTHPVRSRAVEFWNWFASIADELERDFENKSILNELDARVASFGGVTWEIGLGMQKPNALVLSPNGVKDRLSLTQQIVGVAPRLKNWEFFPAKPPKTWNLRFDLETGGGRHMEVDASEWSYVLLRAKDQQFDLVVRAPNLADADEETKIMAAEIAVDGVAGELRRLQCIGDIDVVADLEPGLEAKATIFPSLGDHLRAVCAGELPPT